MNKYQEAFDKIYWANPNRYDYTDEHLMLQELVDRATPKKISYCTNGASICPNCEHSPFDYMGNRAKFCPHCGQALDWEKEGNK